MIKKGNIFFQEKKYYEAIVAYEKALSKVVERDVYKSVEINLKLANEYYQRNHSIDSDEKSEASLIIKRASDKDVSIIASSNFFDDDWYLKKYFKCTESFENQRFFLARHYLEEGSAKKYDPSNEFSAEDYLSLYPSVRANSVNPLLHYVLHGEKKGFKRKAQLSPYEYTEGGLIDVYLCCWLRSKESLHDRVYELYDELRALGNRVKMVTHSECLLDIDGVDAYNVSFSLLGMPIYNKCECFDVPLFIMNDVLEVLKYRVISTGRDIDPSYEYELSLIVKKAYTFWHAEFDRNKPSYVLVWGSTCPMSRLHIHLCNQLNIPYLVLERGHFPKSIGVDTFGQFSHGGSQRLFSPSFFDSNYYNAISEWIRDNDETPYAHKNKHSVEEDLSLQNKIKGKEVILFIGVNDDGSGISYSSENVLERHSTSYHSSFSALEDLIIILDKLDGCAILLVKPHPADKKITYYDREDVVVLSDYNINHLISISDVCVTLSTTSIARCLFEQKPLLTLCETEVSGKNIAYECSDAHSLLTALRVAISKEGFEDKKRNAKVYLQSIFQSKLFFSKNESELFLSTADLAKQLSRFGKFIKGKKENTVREAITYARYDYNGVYSVTESSWRPLCIVIPVYSDAVISKRAIDSVIKAIQEFNDVTLCIVNDCSKENDIWDMLDSYQSIPNVNIYSNEINLGFSGSVNKGIFLSSESDVLLFNSDAVISGADCIKNLRLAAYSHFRIATVTPFSNNAGIYSVPLKSGFPLDLDCAENVVDSYNATLRKMKNYFSIEMPVGHGFCMLIRRSAINEIGLFDEVSFGVGYSEEIDFCLKARLHGLKNVLAPDVFVGHVGGVSFKDNATPLRVKNRRIIDMRYPGYFDEVREFREKDFVKKYRPLKNT